VTGILAKLSEESGAVYANSEAQATVKLSSFETELDGTTNAFKIVNRIMNILEELRISIDNVPMVYNDNEANIQFVKDINVVKGSRHMELRMWYVKEEYQKGKLELVHMNGIDLPADKLTKLAGFSDHRMFTKNIMGLNLLDQDYYVNQDSG